MKGEFFTVDLKDDLVGGDFHDGEALAFDYELIADGKGAFLHVLSSHRKTVSHQRAASPGSFKGHANIAELVTSALSYPASILTSDPAHLRVAVEASAGRRLRNSSGLLYKGGKNYTGNSREIDESLRSSRIS